MSASVDDQQAIALATLREAGLPERVVFEWITLLPPFSAASAAPPELESDAARLAAFCRSAEKLLSTLPPKSKRAAAGLTAADLLKARANEARVQFLRRHLDAVYRALTHEFRDFLRLDALVSAAADAFPGLVPGSATVQEDRQRSLGEKEGHELAQGLFISHVLANQRAGLHLLHAMQRPTKQAESLLPRFRFLDALDIGPVRVERHAGAGHVVLMNTPYLNAEDDSTVLPLETAIDLVLLDPTITVGVLRGGVVAHTKYAGRRIFNAGINLTHLYYGRISLLDFFLARELGVINKLYRGLSGPEFLPDEPEATQEKPWIAAVEAFAIGGGCQLLLVMDRVIAEEGSFFSVPAQKEGLVPGAANLRLPRLVGDRLARQAILDERIFEAGSREGDLLCNEVVAAGDMDDAIAESVERLSAAGAVGASANRKALRMSQEPLDHFRRYMALYAREQALCHVSPELVRNLEQHWNVHSRVLREPESE